MWPTVHLHQAKEKVKKTQSTPKGRKWEKRKKENRKRGTKTLIKWNLRKAEEHNNASEYAKRNACARTQVGQQTCVLAGR